MLQKLCCPEPVAGAGQDGLHNTDDVERGGGNMPKKGICDVL